MRFRIIITLFLALTLIACEKKPASSADRALALVKQWVNGNYNNIAQAEADVAANLPPNMMHRPMHQLFVPVSVPALEGYIVYQQSSLDGSETPAMIFRHGLMQYFTDTETGDLRQRELYFKDAEPYKNAHRNTSILKDITPENLTWDAGCDFFLKPDQDVTTVAGPLLAGQCVLFNQGTQSNLYADDLVEITSTEYRFRGRYLNAEGQVMWGTESNELNRLVRQPQQ